MANKFECDEDNFIVQSDHKEEVVEMAKMHMDKYHKDFKTSAKEIWTKMQEL